MARRKLLEREYEEKDVISALNPEAAMGLYVKGREDYFAADKRSCKRDN